MDDRDGAGAVHAVDVTRTERVEWTVAATGRWRAPSFLMEASFFRSRKAVKGAHRAPPQAGFAP
jgi:hypothetical protein